ncbi:MAG: M24 family metallopeptidase [bacterium]
MAAVALDRSALRQDVRRRILAIQQVMQERDLKIMLAVSSGAPSQTGWIRYLTAADLWSGQAYIILERDHPEPIIVLWSNYLGEWIKSMATTTRVESTLERRVAPIRRVLELVADLTGGTGRVGTLNFDRSVLVGDYHAFKEAYPHLELVDMTDRVNLIRQIKSPFEIEAMREIGRTLVQGFKIFEEEARPGRRALEISGAIEGFLRGKGYNWGRAKYSLDQRPYTLPVAPARRFQEDDVILFQYVFQSSLGYWYEVARLYSFRPLPKDTQRRYRAMDEAMHEIGKMCMPGCTYGAISEASDRIFRDHGLNVVGKHTEDVHSIGTDISDGPTWYTEQWQLKENMVVALHPASLVEGDFAFFICENYVITPRGAEPLSPLPSFYGQLRAS